MTSFEVQNQSDGKMEARSLQDVSCKALFICDDSGLSGLHLLAGLGYDQALAHTLQIGASPSCKVGDLSRLVIH